MGRNSHGVVRLLRYHDWLVQGRIHPRRTLRVIADAGPLLQFDGQDGMGQALARDAIACGMARAAEMGVALVALRRAGHIGRLGAYAEQACAGGFVSVQSANVVGSRIAAPFGPARARHLDGARGGRRAARARCGRLHPRLRDLAGGRGQSARGGAGGHAASPDALVDGEGRPTDDPRALR